MRVASSGLVLVLDPDEAGQRAAEKNGKYLLDLFSDWGEPRYPSEPTSQAIASIQRACDDLAEEIQALDAAGGDSLDRSDMRAILFEYMDVLLREERVTLYTKCHTAEEYISALTIEATPMVDGGPPRIDYAAIKRDVDIVTYIEGFGPLRKSGRTYRGKCSLPGHQGERTASMYVYPDTSSFYCFGCNRGGDVIEYAKLHGVSAREIV